MGIWVCSLNVTRGIVFVHFIVIPSYCHIPARMTRASSAASPVAKARGCCYRCCSLHFFLAARHALSATVCLLPPSRFRPDFANDAFAAVMQEGLLFAHKDWHYEPGPSSFLLRWRDESTSASLKARSPLPTAAEADAAGGGHASGLHSSATGFLGVLEALPSGALATRDDAIVGSISADDVRRCGIVPGDLVACTYRAIEWVAKPATSSSGADTAASASAADAGAAVKAASSGVMSDDHDSDFSDDDDDDHAGSSAEHTAVGAVSSSSPAGTLAPVLAGLHVVCKEANPQRVHADLLSRLLFQVQQASPDAAITIATIAAAVAKTV